MDTAGLGLGASKAGAPTDPLEFVKRPTVILRIASCISAIIVFSCIQSEGWQFNQTESKEICIMNGSSTACNLGNTVAVMAFLAAIGFTVWEYFYDQMSSIKSKKHFLWADMGFSGLWAFFYFVAFCVMAHQWSQAESPPAGYGHMNMRAAIFFAFVAIFIEAIIWFLAYQRYKAGFESAFGGGIDEATLGGQTGGEGGYQAYQTEAGGYADPPFSQQGGGGNYDSVHY
eukprot:TRINITY_DN5336_c0_g1_i1.p1 TRINITY_DN5336_c0_g1~~TRINITY_DN5336_c0_g1_i1.p1  ORF type:complete len:229 (+),score=49.22 TRINITY_DN5336_c0_g1_i1:291-977(+)